MIVSSTYFAMHPRAYGAALYIRSTHGTETTVRIVCSKNKLAPLKRVTLPRLEPIAVLIGARLLNYFCQKTGHDVTEATLWSDSTVTLGWIRNDPNRWRHSSGTMLWKYTTTLPPRSGNTVQARTIRPITYHEELPPSN